MTISTTLRRTSLKAVSTTFASHRNLLIILTATAAHGRTPRVPRGRNGGGTRRGGSHAGDDRSFLQESGIFGDADFDQSYDDYDDHRPIPGMNPAQREAERLQRLEMERIAREHGQRVPPSRFRTWIRKFISFAVRVAYAIYDT